MVNTINVSFSLDLNLDVLIQEIKIEAVAALSYID